MNHDKRHVFGDVVDARQSSKIHHIILPCNVLFCSLSFLVEYLKQDLLPKRHPTYHREKKGLRLKNNNKYEPCHPQQPTRHGKFPKQFSPTKSTGPFKKSPATNLERGPAKTINSGDAAKLRNSKHHFSPVSLSIPPSSTPGRILGIPSSPWRYMRGIR